MPLTDAAVRNAKPSAKPIKMFDGGGLFLLLNPTGTRWWRIKFRVDGKERLLSVGTYPEISLAKARERREEIRRLLALGIDPSAERKAVKASRLEANANSFEAVAREWHAKLLRNWSPGHGATVLDRLENNVFPWIGTRPVTGISSPELLAVLRRIESRGALETAHLVGQCCSQVFRYAIATGRAERDPYPDLRGALPQPNRLIWPALRIRSRSVNSCGQFTATKGTL